MSSWTLTARWIFPVAGPPLERGCVTVDGKRIAAIESYGARKPDVDLGNTAVLPGLVNAHTHLDLTGLRGRCPTTPDFTAWLRQVIAHRRRRSPEEVQADIREGLAECLRFGTTLIGDISSYGASWHTLAHAPLRAVVFREVLGLTEQRAATEWESLSLWLSVIGTTPTMRKGISPHAPYSVRSNLFSPAVWQGVPVTVHLAETAAELELLAEHRGPFVSFLQELGAWWPDGLVRGAEDVLHLTRGLNRVLYAHGNYLPPDAPIPPNGSLVYCPRTHAAFGHPPHPFRDFLAHGVCVALGTDSLASNPDLNLLEEARFLHRRYSGVPGPAVLRMATLSGAEALGWADETGSLEPGKSADLVVLTLPDAERGDPHQLVLDSACSVQRVLWRGQWRSGAVP
jgi:cytosine/adenosine deaminase-related metal-dependent hydrolase